MRSNIRTNKTLRDIFLLMAEKLVGVIPHVLLATGHVQSKQFTIIVTSQRLIIAQFAAKQMQEAMVQSKARAKSFFEKLAAGRVLTAKDVVEYCRKYFSMSPELVLAESQGNFAIDLAGITSVAIDHQVDPEDEDSKIQMDRYIMTIISSMSENVYVVDADPQDMELLRSVLGERAQGEGRVKPIRPQF